MTAQISDSFFYNKKEYRLVAISEEIKFKPEDYGITPEMISTACWRGFYCDYIIKDEMLYLNQFTVNSADGNYPEINGKMPVSVAFYYDELSEAEKDTYDGPHQYKNLELPIAFTGKIILGDEFLWEYYIHMGFQRAWAYEKLIELEIEEGIVINVTDHSEKAKELRQKINTDKSEFDKQLRRNILGFVENSFSLELKDKTWWID